MKIHAAIAATLADFGLTTMFGVQGDGNMFMIDSFVHDHEGRYVSTSNEAGSVIMASGYAFASGQVGVATVTQGPGLANALAALTVAAKEHAVMILIVGDESTRGHTQNVDQASFVLPTGAGFEVAHSPETTHLDLQRAVQRAISEKRPIVFNVENEFTFMESTYTNGQTPALLAHQNIRPTPEALDDAVGLIASARRPLVLAGIGAVWPDASEALTALAERLGAPLATTLPAKGLFGSSKYNLGVFGSLSSARAAEAIMECDCVIGVGASLNRLTGGGDGWPFLQGKKVVRCDASAAALSSHFQADASVLADAVNFATTVVDWLDEAEYVGTSFRDAYVKMEVVEEPAPASDGEFVDFKYALNFFNRILPTNRSVSVDGGRFARYVIEILDVFNPRGFAQGGRGFGSVGNGFTTAIGIGCAIQDAPVATFVGDGGFMLGGLAEFNTAVRHGVDLITVICNDGSYGAEYRKLQAKGFSPETSLYDWPDFAPVADALGGTGVTVRSRADLEKVVEVIEKRNRPVLIDLKLDPASIS